MASDAITLIKQDHRLMEQLFALMESGEGDRAALVKECVARLSAHSWAEEERVYPAIVQADPPDRGKVYHGVEEHHEAEELLHRLQEADPGSAEFDTMLEKFVAAVKHHVEEEETKILPALAKSVEPTRLVELGAAFEERRKAVLEQHGFSDGAVGQAAGKSSAKTGGEPADLTRDELYEQAKQAGVPGRSQMTKDELARAVRGTGNRRWSPI